MAYLLVLILATLCTTGHGLSITPVSDGIMVKRGLSVHTKLMEWRVTFALDDPSLEMKKVLLSEIIALRKILSDLPPTSTSRMNVPYWLKELARVEYRTEALVHRKVRRSLLPFIGSIAHDLFGTATTQEVEQVMRAVNENRNAMNRVINFQNEQLTIINVTKEELKQNRKTINELITLTSTLGEQIANITAITHTYFYSQYRWNLIQDHIITLCQQVDELQAVSLLNMAQRDLLEQGRLGEQLIAKETLEEVITLHAVSGIEPVKPLEWYYSNCKVFPIWNQDSLVFMARLPLIDSSPQEGFRIETFPVPLPNGNVTARLKVKDFLTMTAKGDLQTPSHCVGNEPIVCDPSPARKDEDDEKRCAQAIILREKNVVDYCPVELQVYPDGLLFQEVPNHVILVTRGEIVHEQCSGKDDHKALEDGTYHVEWDGACVLSTKTWSLRGVRNRELQREITHSWKPWDIIGLNLPTVIHNTPSTKDLKFPSRLSDPKTVRLNFLPTLPPLTVETNLNYHYFWLIALMLFIVPCILLFKFKAKIWSRLRPKREAKEKGKEEPFKLQIQTSPENHPSLETA